MEHYSSNNGISSRAGAFLCRQSSTRWIPTSDQIRILRELYYNNGVRSPTAEQIQRITARLRQFGKIEGKNVFYWFQNHKARERQKKKLNAANAPAPPGPTIHLPPNYHASATGFYDNNGQAGGNGAAGSMFIETSFRECCLSGGEGQGVDNNNNNNNNIGWVYGLEPWMYQCTKEEDEEDESNAAAAATRDIQILPLFPTRSQEQQQEQEQLQEDHSYGYPYNNNNSNVAAAASLELTLNSYYYAPPGC